MANIQIENLTFTYPGRERPALKGVSLSVRQGEYVALCGRSGSGKTTLLRHLKPVLAPHGKASGTVTLDGTAISALPQRDQAARIGYVMQNPDDQIVTDKVWHELAFGLESLGCPQKTMRARVAEMACYFGIQDWFHRDVAELSGGQKQLLNLASVMASVHCKSFGTKAGNSDSGRTNQPAGPHCRLGFFEHCPENQPGTGNYGAHQRASVGGYSACRRPGGGHGAGRTGGGRRPQGHRTDSI